MNNLYINPSLIGSIVRYKRPYYKDGKSYSLDSQGQIVAINSDGGDFYFLINANGEFFSKSAKDCILNS